MEIQGGTVPAVQALSKVNNSRTVNASWLLLREALSPPLWHGYVQSRSQSAFCSSPMTSGHRTLLTEQKNMEFVCVRVCVSLEENEKLSPVFRYSLLGSDTGLATV